MTSSVLVRVVDDVAEGGGEGAVELYLAGVFVTARLVHVSVDERLHRVNVQDVPSDLVIWVRKNISSQGLVH